MRHYFKARLFVLLAGLLAWPALALAQTTPADSAKLLNAQANTLAKQGGAAERAEAIALWRRAAALYHTGGHRADLAGTLNNIGKVHGALGRPDSAVVYFAQSLAIRRELGDRTGEGGMLNNIGGVHLTLGRPDSALVYFAQSLAIWREVGERKGEAFALNNIGAVHRTLGRPDSALVYFAQSLPIRREVGDRTGEGGTLNNLGEVHRTLGRPDSALVYYAQALAIQRAVGDRTGEGATLGNIGAVHQHLLGRPDSAVVYFAQSLAIQRAVGDRTGEGATLNNIGAVHRTLGRPDSALVYYAQSLPIRREVGDRAGEGGTLNNLGEVHRTLGRPDSALVYYAQALAIQRAVGDREHEGATLNNIGWVYLRDVALWNPARAVAYYDSAAAAQAQIAASAGGDQNRMSFAEQDVKLFANWTKAWLARAPEVGEQSAFLSALAAGERGRAQALLELMRSSAGKAGLPVPTPGADLAAEGERLVRSATRGGAAVLSYLVTADTLLAFLALPSGALQVYRTPVSEDTLAAAVHALRLALRVDSAAVRARMLPESMRTAPLLEAPSSQQRGLGIRAAKAGEWSARSRALLDLLFPPELLSRLPVSGELVVIPSGPVNLVPFAALQLPGGELLGLRYGLRYAPSLAAVSEAQARPLRPAVAEALVVGNPEMPVVTTYSGEKIRLSALPGAKEEGRWVAAQVSASVLSGREATEARVRQRLPTASLVHLATHGYAYSSEAQARQSFIALAPGPEEDGLLTVGEVLDRVPSLSAELVVLSACQTGLGDLMQAEGIVGLQRAFLAKGAKSVLVSLWSVSDEATEKLMRSFYTHWLSGSSKAEALRRAQEEVRKTKGFKDPKYWAAFQLVGAS